MLIVVIGQPRYSDKYLSESLRKGSVKVPFGREYSEIGTLFVFDDVTSLGMNCPSDLLKTLSENNSPTFVFKAEELAQSLVEILPVTDKLTVLDGGGVLSYLFLKKSGYSGSLQEIIKVNREYFEGRPSCFLEQKPKNSPELILDDILASGQTLNTLLIEYSVPTEVVCLMASANVPKGKEGYRFREGSTLPNTKRLYCGQFVNGLVDENKSNRKPAILSLRYLLTKAVDKGDYSEAYLAKKFGGQERAREICSLLNGVNREPIDLLRRNPRRFLLEYGVR